MLQHVADLSTDFRQVRLVVLQFADGRSDLLAEAVAVDVVPVCIGGRGEPVWHGNFLGPELGDHLAEGSVLAADLCAVLAAQRIQPED